ncbi:MAG: hypothetical protein ACE5GW_09765 [Planctomycetota bacterium]
MKGHTRTMQKIRRRKLGEILVSQGLVNRDALQVALQKQTETGDPIGEILLKEGVITESDIVRCICSQYQIPFIRPSAYQINAELFEGFTAEFLYRHRVVPLDRIGKCVIIALGEIPPEWVEKKLVDILKGELYYYFSPITDVETTLCKHFSLSQEQIFAIDEERRAMNRMGQEPAASVTVGESLFENLDSSWEAIFDEAEKNLSEQS